MILRLLRNVPLAAGTILLAACAAATSAYRPASSDGASGYTERSLSADRYLVTFTGGQNMDLPEVRLYLRRRSAEVTLREGYSHFVIFETHNEAEIHTLPSVDYWNPENGYLAGYINKSGPSSSHRELGVAGGRSVSDSSKTMRYTAYSEIVLLKGEEAAKNPDAQSAREVLDRLAAEPKP